MEIKIYDYLPDEAKEIRCEVFCKEQGFLDEFDETDEVAAHLVAFNSGTPIATCRVFKDEKDTHTVGRVAVVKAWRGKNIGADILAEAENYIRNNGGKEISVSAQKRVEEFYKKQGYTPLGSIYFDEDCPHIKMIKKLF